MKLHLPVKLFRAVLACMAAVSFVSFTSSTSTCFAATEEEKEENELLMLLSEPEYPNGSKTYTTRQTSALTLTGYESILFKDISSTSSGGAIYNSGSSSTFTLSDNAAVTFSGNTGSSYKAEGGAIYNGGTFTLSDNEVVTFSGNTASSSYGGAIYNSTNSTFTLSGNGEVTFSGNTASSFGGAIFNNATFTLSDNEVVTFSGNTASTSSNGDFFGGAIYNFDTFALRDNGAVTFNGNTAFTGSSPYSSPYGGAIYNIGTFTLSGNGATTFSGNTASSLNSSDSYAYSGAICNRGSFSLNGNGDVTFSGNSVVAGEYSYGGAIYNNSYGTSEFFSLNDNGDVVFTENTAISSKSSSGGAICNMNITFTLSGNGDVSFSENKAFSSSESSDNGSSRGGAIYSDSSFTLSGNGDVTFSSNTVSSSYKAEGGAIYHNAYNYNSGSNASFTLSGNGEVLFEKNAEVSNGTYRLRSIYSTATLNLSALAGKSILFKDSLYARGKLNLNQDYTDSEGVVHKSTGDIIFTGATTEADLREVKGGIDGTATEITNSRTSEIATMTNLYAGRLIVEDKAILNGQGITAFADSGATVRVKDGTLNHSGSALTFNNSTTLEAEGASSITASTVAMKAGSTLSFVVGEANLTTAALTLTGTLTTETISIAISGIDVSEQGRYTYALMKASSYDTSAWTADKIAVVTEGVSFNDLVWNNGTLYLNYANLPALTTATWTNASGDGLWNASSLNWTQDGYSYAYADGIDVIFGNEGAGTVSLVGNLAPKSVLVDNGSGFDYTFVGEGKLTGSTFLTKQGEGKLVINTANSYTGGTIINGGTLVAGNAAALGSGGVTLNCGKLEIATNGFANDIAFAGDSALIVDEGYELLINKRIVNKSHNLTLVGSIAFKDISSISGGAICNRATFTLSGNGAVTFSGNTASSLGGAIFNSSDATFTLNGNGDVTFSGNTVSLNGGAIDNHGTFTLSDNEAVTFSGNTASSTGGAIYNYDNTTFTLSGNGAVTFSNNTASSYGGAIYNSGSNASFTLSGNGEVLFEKNAKVSNGTYRLRSIYSSGILNLSALAGKSILFKDSLYARGTVNLNQDYTDSEGVVHKSTGDIIFTGATTEADLREVKGGVDGTAVEILNSRTSEIATMTNLYGGRLIVEDKAILMGHGITAAADSGATVRVKDGTLDHSGYALTFNTGTTLEAEGVNAVTADSVDMLAGSTLSFVLGEANLTTATLTLTGTLTTETISIAISGLDESELGHDTYALLSATTYDTSAWTADKITVVTEGVSFENLVWKDGTLYLNYIPDLTAATWTNASGDGLWNASSLNWMQDGHSYAYADGVDVIFGNEGAGTVSLVGNLAPKSVLINNGSGFDYTFAGTGKLTGTTALTKQGAGKLTINTANDYTGGTAINGGTLVAGNAAALGTGAVAVNGGTLEIAANGFVNDMSFAGTSSLVVDAGYQLALSKMLANSGVLTVSGTLNASSLTLNTIAATHVDVNGNSGASGFAKGAFYSVQVVNGGTVAGTAASITHLNLPTGETLVLGSDGVATAGGAIDYSEYLLTGSDTASSSAIHGVEGAANATVTQTGGTLTVDDTVTVNGTGGAITLNGGTLNGSLQGMTIDAVAGTLAATLAGNNTLIGHDFALNAPLDNQGTLVLNGSFDLSGMTPTTSAPTHIDVNGNSGASGFAKTELQEVAIATGGNINASGATFTHNGHTLTLGEGGVASVGGEVDYSKYLLTGSDTVSSSAIHGVAGAANATVTQNGGTLTVDDTVTVTTTGGTIALNGGTLNGTVSGATINATSGTIGATLSGANTLNGNNYALGNVIANQGTLTVSGSFDASALTLNTTNATHIDVNGNSGASGFAKDAFYDVTIATGTVVNNGATVTHGQHTLTLGADGVATADGVVDYSTYFLHNGAEVAVSAIRAIPEAADTKVDMDGGKLAADADVFVTATGGRIEVSHGADVAGSIRDTQIAIHGCEISADITGNSSVYVDGDTILSGHNTYTGNTEVHPGGYLTVSGSITSDVYLYAGTLDTATGMTLASGQDVFFRGGMVKGNMSTAGGSGLNLNQDSMLDGSLTLGGGTLTLSNGAVLTVSGSLTLDTPTKLVGDWAPDHVYTLAEAGSITNNSGNLNEFFSVDAAVGTVKQEGNRLILEMLEQTAIAPDETDIAVVNSLWGSLSSVRDFARLAEQQHLIGVPGQTVLWAGAFGSFSDVSDAHPFKVNSGGYAVGAQQAFTESFRCGVALGQSTGTVESKGAARIKDDQKGMMAALTLQYEQALKGRNRALINGYAALGRVENDAKGAVNANWDDTVLSIGGRASFAVACGENTWAIPFVGLEWSRAQQGSFSRADGGRYSDGEMSLLTLPVGVTLRSEERFADGVVFAPELTLAYEANLAKDAPQSTRRSGTKSCTPEGYDPGAGSFMVNGAFNVLFNEHWSVGASYTLRMADQSVNHGMNAAVRYAF